MAPKASKHISLNTHPLGKQKCALAASLASTDNVDPLAIKRCRHEADAVTASTADDEICNQTQSPDPFELTRKNLDRDVANSDVEHQSDSEGDVAVYMPIDVEDDVEPEDDVEVVEVTDEEKLGKSYIIFKSKS
jgi:hypothetical protein